MNPKKEILDEVESYRLYQTRLIKKNKDKINTKILLSKDITVFQNKVIGFFVNVINYRDSLLLIEQINLDLRIWQILTERINILLKLESTNNYKDIILEDLKNLYNFYKNIYLMICDKPFSERLVSSILFFLGEIKKIKIIIQKKEGNDNEMISKDAKEALKFYQFSLQKNPNNVRAYFNIGLIYRECYNDYTTSSYWFVRSLAAPNSEMNKLKDNLEKDFNIIRQIFNEKAYLVEDTASYVNYDAEHMLLLFHRLMGILYMNIDLDKVEDLTSDFLRIIKKVLRYYHNIREDIIISYETNLAWEQLVILIIFNYHYNINLLDEYSKENEKICFNMENFKSSLIFELFDHKLQSTSDKTLIKYAFKLMFPLIKGLIFTLSNTYMKENKDIIEKTLLLFFYWLSLNYDLLAQMLQDKELIEGLEYINYIISKELELVPLVDKEQAIYLLNNYICPIEVNFMAFRPMMRFFDLYNKKTVFKNDIVQKEALMTKLALQHFLIKFNVSAVFHQTKEDLYYLNDRESSLKTTVVFKDKQEYIEEPLKQVFSLNVKKVKPLILLDMANIAMRHGNGVFSTKGIKSCLEFFLANGHEVNGFLPEYLFRKDISNQGRRLVPDDINYLLELFKKGFVIQTPAQDYDDSYNIQYCKSKNAYFVTNDLYRDYLDKIPELKLKESEKRWIVLKRISYTFNRDEFIPGPDSEFFKEYNYSAYMKVNDGNQNKD